MQLAKSTLPNHVLDGHWHVFGYCIARKAVFPIVLTVIAVGGIFSPLFDLNAIHGIPTAKLYVQHIYFDGIADAGGFYAATFCAHWYHKIPIAVGIALLTTLALVTLIG
jgi:hypothetical protein